MPEGPEGAANGGQGNTPQRTPDQVRKSGEVSEDWLGHKGVPVLSVHDSFIIDYTRVGELKRVMAAASAEVAGVALPVSAKALGLDEMEAEHRVDYIACYQVPRTLGFLERLERWEARTGVTVVPYDKGVVW